MPSPRIINVQVFLNHEIYRVDENNVLLFPFAQSSAHDISGLPNDIISEKNGKLISYNQLDFLQSYLVILYQTRNLGNAIDCCSAENKKNKYPQCLEIIEATDDPVYSTFNVTCTGTFRAKTSRNYYDCPLYPTTFVSKICLNFHHIA